MLIISRQNNKIHYTYQPLDNVHIHSNKFSLPPIPLVNRTSLHQVPLTKWYVVNKDVVDHIIDTYIETFYDFIYERPRYNVQLDDNKFREYMIRNLYKSSQNRNKNFI